MIFRYLQILCFVFILSFQPCFGQVKGVKNIKLTAEQQKAIKKAKELGISSSDEVEELTLSNEDHPDFISKEKDQQRISKIPNIALEKNAMLSYLDKITKAVETVSTKTVVDNVNQYSEQKSPFETNFASIFSWYQKRDEEALLLSLKAARQMPDSAMVWNNAGAMLNMLNMEEYAIPFLKYGKKKDSSDVSVLNNLGQAYLALGDITNAEQYLQSCLIKAPKHPEAIRSMGIIELSKGNKAKAALCFEEDIKNNLRKSSFDWLKKIKKRQDIQLNAMRKAFLKSKKTSDKNFYGMLALDQLSLPDLPMKSEQTEKWEIQSADYIKSLTDEYQFWSNASTVMSEEDEAYNTHRTEPYYAWLVDEVVNELTAVYNNELLPSSKSFTKEMTERMEVYQSKLNAINCPQAPPGSSTEVQRAYDHECHKLHKAVIDPFMAEQNGKIEHQFQFRNGQWKSFLNELISTIETAPTPDNKKIASMYISHYANFLMGTVQQVVAIENPAEGDYLTDEEATALIKQSKRELKLKCPEWLNYKIPVKSVGSITLSCAEFQIEANLPGQVVSGGYKRSFTDKTTTLYVGAGLSGSTGHLEAGVGVQGYLVFDKNEQLINTGVSSEAKLEIPNGIFELSATAKMEMNTGYSHEVKTNSRWAQELKTTISKF